MNTTKPDSLFQSMEKWIDLYRGINKCSEDEAHDAFDVWSEKLRGESADQTTKSFHTAVADEVVEMQSRRFHQQSKWHMYHLSAKHLDHKRLEDQCSLWSKHLALIGGKELIESRKATKAIMHSGLMDNLEPGSASAANKQFQENLERMHQGINGPTSYANLGSMSDPLIETGKDPLSFKDIQDDVKSAESLTSADILLAQAEMDVQINTGFLVDTKFPSEHPAVVRALATISKAKRTIELARGIVERSKERKVLSLKPKGDQS